MRAPAAGTAIGRPLSAAHRQELLLAGAEHERFSTLAALDQPIRPGHTRPPSLLATAAVGTLWLRSARPMPAATNQVAPATTKMSPMLKTFAIAVTGRMSPRNGRRVAGSIKRDFSL